MSGRGGEDKKRRRRSDRGRYVGSGGGKPHPSNRQRGGNPRRGGPGVLLTCESGREGKCLREGLEILRHYYYSSQQKDKGDKKCGHGDGRSDGEKDAGESSSGKRRVLSLEEELALLKSGASADEVLQRSDAGQSDEGCGRISPFDVYETGCRGTVFVMCTLPGCNLIPVARPTSVNAGAKNDDSGGTRHGASNESDDVPSKKRKIGDEDSGGKTDDVAHASKLALDGEDKVVETPPWDPIDTVQRVIGDLTGTNSDAAPNSRFVTRMIPIQATCFASLEEIRRTVRSLLDRYLLPATVNSKMATFEVAFKRRNCSNVKREEVIDAVAKTVGELGLAEKSEGSEDETTLVAPKFKVDLTDPDFTIQIEICKTLCGLSVVPNSRSFKNFNLLEIRQKNSQKEEEK